MMQTKQKAKYWDNLAKNSASATRFDDLMAEQYRRVHLNLLSGWTDVRESRRILKTDLFAEAMHPNRAFLCEIMKINKNVVGIDISPEIASMARKRAARHCEDFSDAYLGCDVKNLPFANNSFDLIISDSTLDHFHREDEIVTALLELSRVIKPGGTLILTMDNKSNVTEPLFRLWILLGLSPFFIGKTYSVKELKQALESVGLHVVDTTAIMHNPRFFTKAVIALIRKIAPRRFDGLIRKTLVFFDSLERRRTRYLTAQFIAAKAVKTV
ncbi:MAG: class I SAM-dependent methyltransferase [Chloroflexi bacterium]|nr:class I SAM-dependent methyltransferase [Chloroflexota bacterium]